MHRAGGGNEKGTGDAAGTELTPNFDEVSMNLSCTCSRSRREVWTMSDLRRVMTRFLVPGMHPLRRRKSFLTIP